MFNVVAFCRSERTEGGRVVRHEYHLGDFCRILIENDIIVVGQILDIKMKSKGYAPDIFVRWFSSARELGLYRSDLELWLTHQKEWTTADSIVEKVMVWPKEDFDTIFSSQNRTAPPPNNLYFSHEIIKGPQQPEGYRIIRSACPTFKLRDELRQEEHASTFTFFEFWKRLLVRKIYSCLNMRGGVCRVRIDTPRQIMSKVFANFPLLKKTATQMIWSRIPLSTFWDEVGEDAFVRRFDSGATAAVKEETTVWRYYFHKELLTFRFTIARVTSEGLELDFSSRSFAAANADADMFVSVRVMDWYTKDVLGLLEKVETTTTFSELAELVDLNQIVLYSDGSIVQEEDLMFSIDPSASESTICRPHDLIVSVLRHAAEEQGVYFVFAKARESHADE